MIAPTLPIPASTDERIVRLAGEANRADLVFEVARWTFVCDCRDGTHPWRSRRREAEGAARLFVDAARDPWHVIAVDRVVAQTEPYVVAGGAR